MLQSINQSILTFKIRLIMQNISQALTIYIYDSENKCDFEQEENRL